MNKSNRRLYPEHYNLLYKLLDALDEARGKQGVTIHETDDDYLVIVGTPKGKVPKPRNRQVQD